MNAGHQMERGWAYKYEQFKIRIERDAQGAFRILASGPGGEASGQFTPPFSNLELENFLLKVGRTRIGVRRIDSFEMSLVRDFGQKLFQAVFQRDVRDIFRSSLDDARNRGNGLRITFYLTSAPELMDLPWEFLYDEPSFLSISTRTPVVRYLDLPRPPEPLLVQPPLHILCMASSPNDAVPIDVKREREKLERALNGLTQAGLVNIEWLEQATLRELQRKLRQGTYHIFHYIGHSAFDSERKDGMILLEDDEGGGRRAVSGMYLGTLLGDHESLRLAVLNSCEGARTSREDPFSGVAQSLVQQGIPAVVAMQFEITDDAAITFSDEFYSALSNGYPVDAAVTEARKAIFADRNDIEWGTPVLLMRVSDGRIFDINKESGAHFPPMLELDFHAEPEGIVSGDETEWSLKVRNPTEILITNVTVVSSEGNALFSPFDLAPRQQRLLTWKEKPRANTVRKVMVKGLAPQGKRVEIQGTAEVLVRIEASSAIAIGMSQEDKRLVRNLTLLGIFFAAVGIPLNTTFPVYSYIQQSTFYNALSSLILLIVLVGIELFGVGVLTLIVSVMPFQAAVKRNRLSYAMIIDGVISVLILAFSSLSSLGDTGSYNVNPHYLTALSIMPPLLLTGVGTRSLLTRR